ncbi:MAG: TRAP transporter small permease [Vicinamibacterales bacterium]
MTQSRLAVWLDWTLGTIITLVLLAMMIVTVVDVVGRYFFNAPLGAAFEGTEVLLVMVIFAGLPLVTLHDQHIAIDLLDGFFVGTRRLVQHVAVSLVSAAVLALEAWMVWLHAGKIESVQTDVMGLPLAPLARFIAVMVGLAAAMFLVRAISHAFSRASGPDAAAHPPAGP